MRVWIAALLSGLLFGMGLTFSQMVNPEKVLGFLDISRNWDPSLALVMFAALLVSVAGYRVKKGMKKPLLTEEFMVPASKTVDTPLIIGGTLFGIGWGLVGLCPGPAIASLAYGSPQLYWFVSFMLVGLMLGKLINKLNKKAT